jgi:predicted DNA-binding transcriptional regulator AlpA
LTIRKFHTRFITADELVRIGTMTPKVLTTLRDAIAGGANILISGGTSTGKTTILNALAMLLPADAHIVVVEDTAEPQVEHANLVRLEARREQPHAPAITVRDLLRATLRHRPDRIIVGEVRGGEAFDLLQALNTGHAGTLSTNHANSAAQALARLASCALQSGVELPYQAIRQQIADAIQFVLHLSRTDSRRYVQEVIRVGRYDGARDCYQPETLFKHEYQSRQRLSMTRLPARTKGPLRTTVTGAAASKRSGSHNGHHVTTEAALGDTHGAALKLLRLPAVRERTGLSRSTIWRLERRGAFPRHHRISANAVAWIEDDVAEWVRSKIRRWLADKADADHHSDGHGFAVQHRRREAPLANGSEGFRVQERNRSCDAGGGPIRSRLS